MYDYADYDPHTNVILCQQEAKTSTLPCSVSSKCLSNEMYLKKNMITYEYLKCSNTVSVLRSKESEIVDSKIPCN